MLTETNKEMIVGIPRAMSYYSYFPFWYGFFEALGIKVVVSDKTTKQTMSMGSALVVSETCLPIKVYVGHILNLLEKGVDKIFVPSIQSIDYKIYNCSKIRGLPDLIRNVVKKDFTVIDATLDKSEKGCGLYSFLKEAVAPFGITDEIYAVAISQKGKITASYMAGLIVIPFIGWTSGTVAGALTNQLLPDIISNNMGILLYGMFIAVFIPAAKKSKAVLTVVIISATISIFLKYVFPFISSGFSVIICAVVAATVCAALFPVKDEEEEDKA